MKTMKRVVLVVVPLVLLFSSAGWAQAPKPSFAPSTSEKIVLNVDYMFNMTSGTDAKGIAVAKAIKRMKTDYPNIEISLNTVAHDDYQTKILTEAAAGSLPDVFNIKGSWLKNMVTNKQVGNMSEYFAKDPAWAKQFIPDSFNDMTYSKAQWGAPFQMLTCGNIYYNKVIFAKAGYKEFPKTWNDFTDCLVKIKKLGYTPISMGNKGLWVANSCYFGTLGDRCAGEDWFHSIMEHKGASFNDPGIILAVQKLAELAKIGAFNSDLNSIDDSQQRTAFYNGKAACFFDGNWAISDMIVSCPKDVLDNTGIAVLPTIPGGKGKAGRVAGGSGWGNAFAANLTGAKRDAAVLFIMYTTNEIYGKDLLDAGDFPGVAAPSYDYGKLHSFAKKYFDFRKTLVMSPQYDCQFDTAVIDAMNVGFQEILSGQITPEQWGKKVQEAFEQSL